MVCGTYVVCGKMSVKYNNFVRPASPSEARVYTVHPTLNGDEARKLYLEEIKDIVDQNPDCTSYNHVNINYKRSKKRAKCTADITKQLTNKDLFLSAQNNDIDTLIQILDNAPDKINTVDDFGWNLLMIACQSHSVDAVKELLNRDIDTSIRDKAGNSAQSLVIKNRNLVLADLLLTHNKSKHDKLTEETEQKKVKLKEEFACEECNKTYPDKAEHLISTIHNINASKGKKIPASYVIPMSNKGYQLMLKGGWNRESGLGPLGDGKRYPIKATQKKDRKGLGHNKKEEKRKEPVKQNLKVIEKNHRNKRRLEIDFRREFY